MKPVEFPKHVVAIRMSAPELASLQELADRLANGNRSATVRMLVGSALVAAQARATTAADTGAVPAAVSSSLGAVAGHTPTGAAHPPDEATVPPAVAPSTILGA